MREFQRPMDTLKLYIIAYTYIDLPLCTHLLNRTWDDHKSHHYCKMTLHNKDAVQLEMLNHKGFAGGRSIGYMV